MKKLLIVWCSLMILSSCSKQESRDSPSLGKEAYTAENIEMEPPKTSSKPMEFSLEKGSKIIKDGTIKFEVGKLEKAKTEVDALLNSVSGYYEKEKYNAYGNRTTYTLKLRIPNSKFDTVVFLLEKGIGELKSKSLNAKDVTEECVDLTIRLENNLSYLKQYQSILSKAKSIKEILEVQEKIRRIEEEIESKKGRLTFLDDKVKFSTLNLELSELIATDISQGPSFGIRIANAFRNGALGFLNFLVALVHVWPFLILMLILYFGRKSIFNRFSRKQKQS